jgi:hypothetical protein
LNGDPACRRTPNEGFGLAGARRCVAWLAVEATNMQRRHGPLPQRELVGHRLEESD